MQKPWEITEKQAGQIKAEKGVVGCVALEMKNSLARQKVVFAVWYVAQCWCDTEVLLLEGGFGVTYRAIGLD